MFKYKGRSVFEAGDTLDGLAHVVLMSNDEYRRRITAEILVLPKGAVKSIDLDRGDLLCFRYSEMMDREDVMSPDLFSRNFVLHAVELFRRKLHENELGELSAAKEDVERINHREERLRRENEFQRRFRESKREEPLSFYKIPDVGDFHDTGFPDVMRVKSSFVDTGFAA